MVRLQQQQQSRSMVTMVVYAMMMMMIMTQLLSTPVGVHGATSCSTNSVYQCPNCNGIEVKDCFECDGYLSTDTRSGICFNRILFNRHNTNPNDYNNFYHFLWNDLVAAIVWFFIAGVAVSCGVGGGGIFVPLGVVLLQFSPKQAAGLSQCSIFGATLGGLVLNSRGKHPNEHITDQPGIVPTTDDVDGGADSPNVDTDTVVPTDVPVPTTTTNNKNDDDKPPTEITSKNSPTTTIVVAIQERMSQSALASYTGTFYTRPVIHYDMVLFLAPMEIAGALMGVIVQILIPNWLYLILASIVLSITAYKTFGKFQTQRHKEQQNELQVQNEATEMDTTQQHNDTVAAVDDKITTTTNNNNNNKNTSSSTATKTTSIELVRQETTGTTTVKTSSEESGSSNGDSSSTDGGSGRDRGNGNGVATTSHSTITNTIWEDTNETKILRQQYLLDDMRQFPREKIIGLLVIWIVIFVLTLLRGGKGVPSLIGITCESIWYTILIVFQFTWLLSSAIYFGMKLLHKQNDRIQVRYPFQPEDTVWDMKALRFFGTCTFLAGVLAGLIGIGGGMILGPLMLVMGLHPRVSSASTATMIVLTSSSVAVLFVTSGLVPWSYALFYFMVCFLGAVINKSRIDAYVKRTGRASVLIFILASIILFATIGCIYNLFSGLAAKDWCLDGFNQFCKASSNDDDCPIDRALSYGVTFLSN